ncbi:MAG: tilS [Planctomycetaceae bacterium]|nr:tilS [Planctomycetaceae bacterium]
MSFTSSSDSSDFVSALKIGCEACRTRGSRILVAVSGGADSVALLRGLTALRESLELEIHVGHLNHLLRGDASDADADWVLTLSRNLGLPCHLGTRSVLSMAELGKQGLEGAARMARRQFLAQVARENECTQIAVAHTSDDQVETILHHIIRGTGFAGLAGMQPLDFGSPVPFVRPMLAINRQQVESFLAILGQDFRTDMTNQDTDLTRNRIRHELLPTLEREYNPQVRQALLRLGQQARDVHSDERDLSEQLLSESLLESSPQLCRLLCEPFQNQPPHRIRECFVGLWKKQNWPRQQMGFRDWNRLVELLQQPEGAMDLPGRIHVRRRGGLLVISVSRLSES